jgi:hypothetical protein
MLYRLQKYNQKRFWLPKKQMPDNLRKRCNPKNRKRLGNGWFLRPFLGEQGPFAIIFQGGGCPRPSNACQGPLQPHFLVEIFLKKHPPKQAQKAHKRFIFITFA